MYGGSRALVGMAMAMASLVDLDYWDLTAGPAKADMLKGRLNRSRCKAVHRHRAQPGWRGRKRRDQHKGRL